MTPFQQLIDITNKMVKIMCGVQTDIVQGYKENRSSSGPKTNVTKNSNKNEVIEMETPINQNMPKPINIIGLAAAKPPPTLRY